MVRAQGTYPGTDLATAVNVIVAECEPSLFLPSLPERGAAATPLASVSALFEELYWGMGLRTIEMHSRVTRFSRQIKDLWERDWDTFLDILDNQHVGEGPLHFVFPGPYSIAASVELPNGHWALTDPGAVRHIVDELAGSMERLTDKCVTETMRTPVFVIDETTAGAALAGCHPGIHKFEDIPRPLPESVTSQWHKLSGAVRLQGTTDNCTVVRFPHKHCDWMDYVAQLDYLFEQQNQESDTKGRPLRLALNVTDFPVWDVCRIDTIGERIDIWGEVLELMAITGGPAAEMNSRASILAQYLRQLGIKPRINELPVLHSVWGVGTVNRIGDLQCSPSDACNHMCELGQYPQLLLTEWESCPS